VTDGLNGMPEALGAVFSATTLQTCILHHVRTHLDCANWKKRKALAAAIKSIYTTAIAIAAYPLLRQHALALARSRCT
jgi:putative transposase